jgi:hypothetical protein
MQVVNVYTYGGVEQAKKAGVKYVGRPSPLGNHCSAPGVPCPVCKLVHFGPGMKQLTECRSLECYRRWLWHRIEKRDGRILDALEQLNENDLLGCFCKPKSCHADIIAKAWRWCYDNGLFKPIK